MHDDGQLDLRFQMRRSEVENPAYIYVPKAKESKALCPRQTLAVISRQTITRLSAAAVGQTLPGLVLEENVPRSDLPLSAGNNARPLDHILQLANVPRPGVL